jgi:biopolymer transport protein ExbD
MSEFATKIDDLPLPVLETQPTQQQQSQEELQKLMPESPNIDVQVQKKEETQSEHSVSTMNKIQSALFNMNTLLLLVLFVLVSYFLTSGRIISIPKVGEYLINDNAQLLVKGVVFVLLFVAIQQFM